jgi:TRAP-type C4-dicarboxylate transport system substrate-binding protein
VHEALRAGAEAYTSAYIAEQNARVEAALKTMEEGGAKITRLSDEERVRWAAALPQIADAWAKNADGQDLPGSQVLDAYIGLLKESGVNLARDWSQR